MSLPKKRIDFQELEEQFDQNLDSLRYTTDIDSAVQIKKNTAPDRLHDVQQQLHFSPHQHSSKQKPPSVRCSFGATNHIINPLKLQFAANSVNSSLQIQQPDTASFPLQKKFQKLSAVRNSIEELSAEYDCNVDEYDKEKIMQLAMESDQKMTLSGSEDQEYSYYQLLQTLEELMKQLQQKEDENYELQTMLQGSQAQLKKQQAAICQLQQQNQELTQLLDDQQIQMQKLSETNGLLKKKLNQAKTYSTEQSQHHGHTTRNKENSLQEGNLLSQIAKAVNGPQDPQDLIQHTKKISKLNSAYVNVIQMVLLMVQKCFYLDEGLDREGKETVSKLLSQINAKQLVKM